MRDRQKALDKDVKVKLNEADVLRAELDSAETRLALAEKRLDTLKTGVSS